MRQVSYAPMRAIYLVSILLIFPSATVQAFPPFRTTDAHTADPWELETRLGLLGFKRSGSANTYSSPLLRINFGIPQRIELKGEFAYLINENKVDEAAVGFKWVPYLRTIGVGIETLVLLPVSQAGGVGVESLLAVTLYNDSFRYHLNGGGFYDSRPNPNEKGWRGSALVEYRFGRIRAGLDFFSKQIQGDPVQVSVGPGIILDVGPFAFRTGFHAGLTNAAPDWAATFWITKSFYLDKKEESTELR